MTSRRRVPMWNEVDELLDPRPKGIDDQVEMRRRNKPLAECSLPEGFRLVTPTAKQFWIKGQLTWCFELAWAPIDRKGNRGEDQHKHVSRYIWTVPDELQLCWALSDFMKELADKDVKLGSLKEQEPKRRATVIPMHPWLRASA